MGNLGIRSENLVGVNANDYVINGSTANYYGHEGRLNNSDHYMLIDIQTTDPTCGTIENYVFVVGDYQGTFNVTPIDVWTDNGGLKLIKII